MPTKLLMNDFTVKWRPLLQRMAEAYGFVLKKVGAMSNDEILGSFKIVTQHLVHNKYSFLFTPASEKNFTSGHWALGPQAQGLIMVMMSCNLAMIQIGRFFQPNPNTTNHIKNCQSSFQR